MMIIQQLQEKLQRHKTYLDQDPDNRNLQLTVGLLTAQILHHQEQINDAIMLLEQLSFVHESSADVAGLLALLHFDNHDATKAELLSNKARALDPNNYEGRLVHMLLRALKNEASLDEINVLIEINPQDSRLWFALGTTQMRHMDFTAADIAFSQATLIWPNFYDSWICSGWCQLLQNNLEAAKTVYQKAVSIDADAADGWGGLALICALQNEISESKERLQQTERLDPACFLAAITRIILANQTNPEDAAKLFNATFPDVAPEITRILSHAVLGTVSVKEKPHH